MNALSLRKLFIFLIAPAIIFSFKPLAENADFSGKWKLNESKSEFGEFGARFAAKMITIEQKADAITIARNVTTFNGDETTRTETLTFDGKEIESAGGFGNSKRKSTAKWSDDGKTLTISYKITFEFNGETNEVTGKETWTKGADGKTISLKTDSSSPQGDFSTTAIYDKE